MYVFICCLTWFRIGISGLLGSGYKKWWYLGAWRDCQTTLRSQSALGPIIFNLLFLSWSNDIQWLGIWSIGAFKTHQVSFPPVSEPRELVGWNQDSPTNWSSFVFEDSRIAGQQPILGIWPEHPAENARLSYIICNVAIQNSESICVSNALSMWPYNIIIRSSTLICTHHITPPSTDHFLGSPLVFKIHVDFLGIYLWSSWSR